MALQTPNGNLNKVIKANLLGLDTRITTLEGQKVIKVFAYKGSFSAAGGVYPTTPASGDIWLVSTAGTIATIAYAVGDLIIYDGTTWDFLEKATIVSVNGQTGAVTLTSDNINEGTTNLYFTTARAQSAAMVQHKIRTVTTVATINKLVDTKLAYRNLTAAVSQPLPLMVPATDDGYNITVYNNDITNTVTFTDPTTPTALKISYLGALVTSLAVLPSESVTFAYDAGITQWYAY